MNVLEGNGIHIHWREDGDPAVEAEVRTRVEALCDRFPIYPEL